MSCAVRRHPDPQAFIALVDRYAATFGVPGYSELVHAIQEQDQRASDLYGALRETCNHVGDVQVLLSRTGLDQPRAVVELCLEEAVEKAAAASAVAGIALFTVETRVDLDGRDEVTVLADARTRLRAAGRRP